MIDFAEAVVGANGANAVTQRIEEKCERSKVSLMTGGLCRSVRTRVDGSDVLEWTHKKHEHDAHTEDLHTPAGHVQHERLHRQRFSGADCEIPSALFFQASIRRLRYCGGLAWCFRLMK